MESKKETYKRTYLQNRNRVMEVFYYRNRKETYGYQRMRRERDKPEGWDRHRHPTLHKIDNKDLLLNNRVLYWDSLVARTPKHLPAMQETWVQSLGWEDPLEKEMATPPSTLA